MRHIYKNMKRRCLSETCPDYKNYGGRGITICQRWFDSYYHFYNDMGPRPSPLHQLDRIDNDKGYCKENCRWSTPKQNCNNRRTNIEVELNGVTKSITQWTEEFGIDPFVARDRYSRGDRGDKLFRPIRRYRKIIVDGER